MMSASIVRIVRIILVVATASAMLSFAACSNGGSERSASMLPSADVPAEILNLAPSESIRPDTISTKDLFVGEIGNVVEIYQNGTFKKVGQITKGINSPSGAWVDSHGLYVSNYYAPSITEYSSPKSKPFTYSAGMAEPHAVTTDALGDVFEADFEGYINEYPQKSNSVEHTCSIKGAPVGVAVDNKSNVFVVYSAGVYGYIAEFTDFSYCKSNVFGFTVGYPGGMAINKYNTLLVSEYINGKIDIIKPPYTGVSGHLGSGWYEPLTVTINSANNRVWVAENSVVDVYYPSGKLVWKSSPLGANAAVDGSNFHE